MLGIARRPGRRGRRVTRAGGPRRVVIGGVFAVRVAPRVGVACAAMIEKARGNSSHPPGTGERGHDADEPERIEHQAPHARPAPLDGRVRIHDAERVVHYWKTSQLINTTTKTRRNGEDAGKHPGRDVARLFLVPEFSDVILVSRTTLPLQRRANFSNACFGWRELRITHCNALYGFDVRQNLP